MNAVRPALRSFLDAGVPDSIVDVFKNHGHVAIPHRELLPERATDTHVCLQALAIDAILVAIDGDMRAFPKRFGISRSGGSDDDRFARLSIIRLCCNETLAAKRLAQAMTFIEHEWIFSEGKVARRLWVEIGPHHLRSNR